jgi:predicted RNase H-like nuclease (RuvC/YqgF family)
MMIRLYRLYNIEKSDYGEPFGMCDRHAKDYQVSNCVMQKIADKTEYYGCDFCESEKDDSPEEVTKDDTIQNLDQQVTDLKAHTGYQESLIKQLQDRVKDLETQRKMLSKEFNECSRELDKKGKEWEPEWWPEVKRIIRRTINNDR